MAGYDMLFLFLCITMMKKNISHLEVLLLISDALRTGASTITLTALDAAI